MPQISDKRGRAETNELVAGHVRTSGFVRTGQYKTPTVVGRPYLIRTQRFIPVFVFYTQSVLLCPRFIPESVFYIQSAVVRNPQSAIRNPQSTRSRSLGTMLQSAVRRTHGESLL